MARMIPVEIVDEDVPDSERLVFQCLQESLSDEWMVFHSFMFKARYQRRLHDYEVDFLLYHPEKGMIVLEVKGGKITYQDGVWHQENRRINPVRQALRNKYGLYALLEEQFGRKSAFKIAHAVCFPYSSKIGTLPPDARGITLDKPGLKQIDRFVERVLENEPDAANAALIPKEKVMEFLNPVFSGSLPEKARMTDEEARFLMLEKRLKPILSAVKNFKRLQIRGCAGSGKTVMALMKAEELSAQGQRVLVLCYNKMLAKYLKNKTQLKEGVRVIALFEFAVKILREGNVPEEKIRQVQELARTQPDYSRKLYREVLPKTLTQYCMCTGFQYDALIVDEGQDFTEEAWGVIQDFVREDGWFYIFYDPNQNIFTERLSLPDFGYPPIELTQNCRNTKQIVEWLSRYHDGEMTASEASPEGAAVRTLDGDCQTNLAKELERLTVKEKIPTDSIVVLGAHSAQHLFGAKSIQIGEVNLIGDLERKAGNDHEVGYYTYMKFKGRESRVVILYGVDESEPRWNAEGMYTAMSRAKHQLIILRKGESSPQD